jgi:hypothetical protein
VLRPTTRPALLLTSLPRSALLLTARLRPALLRAAVLRAALLLVDEVLEFLRGLIDLARVAELLAGQVGKLVDPVLYLVPVLAQQRLGLALEIVEVDHRFARLSGVSATLRTYEAITQRWVSPGCDVRIG